MGALIRESVATYLTSRATEDDPALQLVGMYEDRRPKPHGDVAQNHDAYLADGYLSEIDPIEASRRGSPPRRRRCSAG